MADRRAIDGSVFPVSRTIMPDLPNRRVLGWPLLFAIWIPLALALLVAILQIGATGLRVPVLGATVTTLLSFALGFGVWVLTDRMPWTADAGWRFYVVHLVGAVTSSALWWMTASWVMSMIRGRNAIGAIGEWLRSDVIGWDVSLGMAFYVSAAGVSYAIRLQQRLQEERLSHARAEAAARGAQLSLLESRLNPHFLFNTLHSVAALVRTDPDGAEDAIDTLGDLLRDALQQQPGLRRSLAEEWAFTARYLDLEQLRLGGRLRLDVQIAEAARTVPVPPLLLQGLVENAVRHGIGQRVHGGCIHIRASVDERFALHLEVADDGEGATDPIPSAGVGLSVTRARVESAVPPGSVHIRTAPGEGFAVSILLPRSA